MLQRTTELDSQFALKNWRLILETKVNMVKMRVCLEVWKYIVYCHTGDIRISIETMEFSETIHKYEVAVINNTIDKNNRKRWMLQIPFLKENVRGIL